MKVAEIIAIVPKVAKIVRIVACRIRERRAMREREETNLNKEGNKGVKGD